MAKRIEDFKVVDNKFISNNTFILELKTGNDLPELKPGQFVQVRIDNNSSVLLRRPFSIHDVDSDRRTIKLLVRIAGKGTESLSRLKKGEILNIIYPLGNSFSMPGREDRVLLIGGGCGVAPLLFLGRYLRSNGYAPSFLLGFKNREHILEIEDYKLLGEVYLTTEDGSSGEKGLVTDHYVLNAGIFNRFYCCGPEPMMKAVAAFSKNQGITCEVTLEHMMACGIGACLCCVVDTVKGHLCSCTDGPVFNVNDLKW